MFRGSHTTRVDDKGRVKIPADFKREIDEKYGAQFYITSYWGQVMEIDSQGRLLLPSLLREKAALKDEVFVVGKLERLDVRVAEDYRKQVEENPITPEDEDALAQLGI